MNQPVILVVDDELIIQRLCRRILLQAGHDAVFAETITEALGKIKVLGRLDLLITDICLPDGDGVEVVAGVREKFPAAKILVITGFSVLDSHSGMFQKLNVREDDILFKPFEASLFEAEVGRRLAQ